MMTWNVEWIGIAAGMLTTCAFFPQVLKTVRSRSTGDLSWAWLVMMTTGVFLWLLYGYYVDSPSVLYANLITFFSLLALLVVKVASARAVAAPRRAEETGEPVRYIVKKRIVGRCCGCGRCDREICPRVVKYKEKVVPAGTNN